MFLRDIKSLIETTYTSIIFDFNRNNYYVPLAVSIGIETVAFGGRIRKLEWRGSPGLPIVLRV